MTHQPYGQQPGYGYPPSPPPYRRKKSSAPLVLGVIAASILLMFGGCAVLVAAVDRGDERSATLTAEQADTTPSQVEKTEDEEDPKIPGIGDRVRDGDFSFKVTKVERRTRVGGTYLNTEAQGVFLLVHVTVKNVGDEAGSFRGANQTLFDTKRREYEASSEAAIYMRESKSLYEKINPGNSVKGVVLFDVPKNAKVSSIRLHDSIFSDGVGVSLRGA